MGTSVHLGADGVPFLTKRGVPDYKHQLPARLGPQDIRKARVDVLDLSDEKQYSLYSMIWDAVGVGIATVVEEERHWVEKSENWKVFVRWYLHARMDPGELRELRLSIAKAAAKQSDASNEETRT